VRVGQELPDSTARTFPGSKRCAPEWRPIQLSALPVVRPASVSRHGPHRRDCCPAENGSVGRVGNAAIVNAMLASHGIAS
jgi:hypothetical protein